MNLSFKDDEKTKLAPSGASDAYTAARASVQARAGLDPSLSALSAAGWERYQRHGWPNTRHEEWKYTSLRRARDLGAQVGLRPVSLELSHEALRTAIAKVVYGQENLLVLVDGTPATALSRLLPEPHLSIGGLSDAGFDVREVLAREPEIWLDHPIANLTQGLLEQVVVIEAKAGQQIAKPLHIVHVVTGAALPALARVVVRVSDGASLKLRETVLGYGGESYLAASRTQIHLDRRASLLHANVQLPGSKGMHFALMQARLSSQAKFHSCSLSHGGALVRHDSVVELAGEAAELTLDGLYQAKGEEHIDVHTSIDHQVPNASSRQLFKGVLGDAAHGVFNGRVIVRPKAIGTLAHQLNRNLLLSEAASIDTKPELLIHADDVKCTHGASVGQLRADEVFYLSSRGLSPDAARALLAAGFAREVILRMDDAALAGPLRRLSEGWFVS